MWKVEPMTAGNSPDSSGSSHVNKSDIFIPGPDIYKSLVEQLPAITYVAALDANSTTLYISPQVKTLLGISQAEHISDPDTWSKLIHPEDQVRVMEELERCHATHSPFVCEYRMRSADGRWVWFRDEAVIVFGKDGSATHLQGVMLDITLQKEAQLLALKTTRMNNKIIERSPVGIAIYESDGRMLIANQAVSDIVGAPMDEVLEQNFRHLDSWKTHGLLHAAEDTLLNGNENRVSLNITTTFGKNVWLDCRLAKISSGDNPLLLMLANDITFLKQTEHELKKHRDHLEEIVKERTSELLALNDHLNSEIELRKKAEQQQAIVLKDLKESRESLRALLDAINESAFLMALDGTVLALNETAATRIGKTSGNIFGKNLYDFLPRDLGLRRKQKVNEAVTTKKAVRFEDERSGRIIDQTVSPIFDDDGSVTAIAVFAMDVTEQRKFEKMVTESEDLFRSTFEQAAVGMAHVSLDGKLIKFNDKMSDILGYSRDHLEGLSFQEVTFPPDLEADLELLRQLLSGEIENYSLEKRYIRRDGSLAWALITVSLRRHPDGSPNHLISVVQDIAQRKAVEGALKARERFLENIFSSIQDGLSILDKDLNIVKVNPVMEKWYSHALPFQGKKCYEVYHGSDKPCSVCPTRRTIETGKLAVDEVPLTGEGGITEGWLELFSFPMFDSETSELVGVIEFVRDISARKKAENDSRNYKEHLERVNLELENFAYVASHDLREPLRKVAGFSELLEKRFRGKLDAKADKYLYYIIDGVQRMQSLIEDLLAYSRLGRISTEMEVIKTSELVRDVLSDLSTSINENYADIRVDELPEIIGHPTQIGQLFQNIISNAIKFKRDVDPEIEISWSQSGANAVFSIRDNGIGISPDQFERIFGIFQRLHSREAYPGTGIGLAVCKKIVELHGGRIWLASEPGRGSEFKFDLKLAYPTVVSS